MASSVTGFRDDSALLKTPLFQFGDLTPQCVIQDSERGFGHEGQVVVGVERCAGGSIPGLSLLSEARS